MEGHCGQHMAHLTLPFACPAALNASPPRPHPRQLVASQPFQDFVRHYVQFTSYIDHVYICMSAFLVSCGVGVAMQHLVREAVLEKGQSVRAVPPIYHFSDKMYCYCANLYYARLCVAHIVA